MAKTEAAAFRQAIADTDWDTVERHGGLNAALKKMNELARESPVSNDRGMIDCCRLRGSRRCRRKGGPFTQEGGSPKWLTHLTTTTLHSQRAFPRCCGRGLAWKALLEAVSHRFPASAETKRSEAAPRVSLDRTARRGAAPEGKEVEGATPVFWRWCATGEG